jgi:FkbM family methyltransferase
LDYSTHITHHFETYFSQVTPDGNEVDYSRPRIHTLASGLKFELSSLPEESPALDSYFRAFRPRPGDTVFDIGAYCGVFTYALSQIVGETGRVIAFEPDPGNAGLLLRNIDRHKLQNVTVVQAAVCDKDGWAQFNCEAALGSALVGFIDRPKPRAVATIQTVTLKTACERFGVPTFIKIDAEGAEIEILSAAIPFLRDHPISFVLDTDHSRDGHLTNTRVEHYFSEAGYCAESSTVTGFMTTWASPQLT